MESTAQMKPMTKLLLNVAIIVGIAIVVSMMIDTEMTDPDTGEAKKRSLFASFLDRSGIKKS